MVERRRDPKDRRAFCLYLTAAAYPLLKKILKLAQQTRVDAIGSLTQKELSAFSETLATMKENLLRIDAAASALTTDFPSAKNREAP
jgi:DNA-binding MarR family transcriptional regulator